MKREEKNLQSRQKIISAAMNEFGEKTYAEASMNTICSNGDISKGIIYHYFKDKDELYLVCVQECFDSLTRYLEGAININEVAIEKGLALYFDARIKFFNENAIYLRLFYSAVITPPNHLISDIEKIRAEFDSLNITVMTKLLEGVNLREDITIADVVNELRVYQDFVNTRYQMQDIDCANMKEHEQSCKRSLNILLYGVIDREN